MREIKFSPGEYYHIYNHGIEEREVFLDDSDFMRGLVSLVTFNDHKDSPHNLSRFVKNPAKLIDHYSHEGRNQLVDIIAFTLLPTHYHFFVREKVENGISRFMHRFSKGYARYFNLKNGRTGSLWKETFKAKHIDNEAYFVHIISYVHLNILDLYQPNWREGEINDWSKVASKLVSYPWSSYGYYRTGSSPIPFMNLILSQPDWFSEYYPEAKSFEERLRAWSTRYLDLAT